MAEFWTEFWGHGILDTHVFTTPAFCHRHLPRFQFMGVHIPTAEFWTPTSLQRLLFAVGSRSGFNSWVSTFQSEMAEFWTPTSLQRLLFAIGICSGFNSWVSTFLLCFFKMQAC